MSYYVGNVGNRALRVRVNTSIGKHALPNILTYFVCPFPISVKRYTHAGLLDLAEDVPFRLTRNMSTLMSPMLVEVWGIIYHRCRRLGHKSWLCSPFSILKLILNVHKVWKIWRIKSHLANLVDVEVVKGNQGKGVLSPLLYFLPIIRETLRNGSERMTTCIHCRPPILSHAWLTAGALFLGFSLWNGGK